MNWKHTIQFWLAGLIVVTTTMSPVWAQRKYPTSGTGSSPTPSKKPAKSTKPSPPPPAPPVKRWEDSLEKGKAARSKNDFPEAELQFGEAVRLAETDKKSSEPLIESLTALADTFFAQEKYTEAEPLWLKVLDLRRKTSGEQHPETAAVQKKIGTLYGLRAEVRTKAGLIEEALLDYTRALEYTPQGMLYGNRADLKAARKDYEGALADLKRATELDRENAGFYSSKTAGIFAARSTGKNNAGDYEGALADLKQA
ncbi:MAG TPA: tetratricopeptide repeat protein, partial [Acidobacteriota bacterium]|nr:tetratricopeptide repeat protein [Acidobacteriota bacterium]